LHAQRHLSLSAANLDNQARAEIAAATSLELSLAQQLQNRGLITAPSALINASTLHNLGTGRIYGDTLAIRATTLSNDSETRDNLTQAGTIAAQTRLDIATTTLHNQNHALILSLGDMTIGNTLDRDHRAIGSADTVNNHAATLEAIGQLRLASHNLHNTNGGVVTENQTVSSQTITEYRIDYESQRRRSDTFLPQGTVIPCNPSNGQGDHCGRPLAVGELKAYPERFGQRDYIRPIYHGQPSLNAQQPLPPPLYQPDAATYRQLGLTMPAAHASRAQQNQALLALHQAITAYNASVQQDNRVKNGGHYYEYHYTVTHTQPVVTHSDPGLIRSGGDMHLISNTLINNKSRIIAGARLSGDLANLHNIGMTGLATTHINGTLRYLSKSRSGEPRASGYSPYVEPPREQTVNLPVYQVQSHTQTIPTAHTIQIGQTHRAIEPTLTLPTTNLYRIHPTASAAQPLIETDPRFTHYPQWLGSQALLTAGTPNPNLTQKRLGDNYYEQQHIRDQVGQLTGRRFLRGYQNDHDQYQALINKGVSVAQTFQLTPGIALTAAQIAQLTSDIVWLVQKPITLADGTTTQVLVPQLYAKIRDGDLQRDGTLIAGDTTHLTLREELQNSGTIAGRTLVDISAQNLNNHHGHIHAADTRLSALLDLNNIGGSFAADHSMTLRAGQDINLHSTTHQRRIQLNSAIGTRTDLDRVAGIYIGRNPGDTTSHLTSLTLQARRDLNLSASEIQNHTNTASTFSANRNINSQTLHTENNQTLSSQSTHRRHTETTRYTQDIGSTIHTLGNLNLHAGQNISAQAAKLTSEQGAVNLTAGRDINLEAGKQTHHFNTVQQQKNSGFLSTSSSTRTDSVSDTHALGSTVSGHTVKATAGNNISLSGSNLVADTQTTLSAANNITVHNAHNHHSERHIVEQKKSGLMSSGGIGFTIGNFQQNNDTKTTESTSSASTIGATNGNVNITAGKTYTQVGSDIIALNRGTHAGNVENPANARNAGNVTITAQSIDILAAQNTASQRVEHKTKQSGLTLAITSPVITAIQTAENMRQAKDKTHSGRMKILADAATVAAAYNAGAAVADKPEQAGGIGINASLGTSQSHSITSQTATTQSLSTINAAGNIKLQASGADQNSDITLIGSTVKATQNIDMTADNNIQLLSAQNTSEQHSTNKSSGGSVGIGFNVGGSKTGFTVSLNIAQGRGKADGKDISHLHSGIDAGAVLNITTQNDLTLQGGSAKAKKITADIGNNLNISSVQDSSTYHSEQKNISAGVAIPIGAGQGSASFNMSKNKIDNNYISVTQQSGFKGKRPAIPPIQRAVNNPSLHF
jgi:filamentous hemagglutinin